MMSKVECWPAAARMLDYLESSGAFGDSPTLRTGVADAGTRIAAHADPARFGANAADASGHHLDDRQALTYMRTTLTDLLTHETRSSPMS
jgi:hypothetical protein